MTIKTIDQQRFDELTEWCRNRPEDAALRIIHAEDWEDSVHPEMLRKPNNKPPLKCGDDIHYIGDDDYIMNLMKGRWYRFVESIHSPLKGKMYRITNENSQIVDVAPSQTAVHNRAMP